MEWQSVLATSIYGLRQQSQNACYLPSLLEERDRLDLYQGMVRLEVEADESDYLLLEYEGGDRLYLPVTRLNLVKSYTAPGEGKVKVVREGSTKKTWRWYPIQHAGVIAVKSIAGT